MIPVLIFRHQETYVPSWVGPMPWFLFSLRFHVCFIMFRLTYKSNKALGTSLAVQWFRLCFQCRGHEFETWLGS